MAVVATCRTGKAGAARARLRCLPRAIQGATTLEFALVAVPFLAILVATLLTALVFFSQQAIQTATESAARLLLTGEAQTSGMGSDQFKAKACQSLPPYFNCGNLLVDVSKANAFSSASVAIPTITFDSTGKASANLAYNVGAAGDILVVRLMYVWPMPSISLGFNAGNLPNGMRLLIGTAVSKTELYQ